MLCGDRLEADGDRAVVGRLQEEQPHEQVVPDLDELQHRDGRDCRDGERQHDPEEDLPVAQPVDQRRLDHVLGQATEVRGHQERRERRPERRVDDDRAVVVVDEAELREVDVLGNDQRLHRDHHRGGDHEEDGAREPVAQRPEGVARRGARDQDDPDRAQGDQGRVEHLAADRQRLEELVPGGQREPAAEVVLGQRPERHLPHQPERVEHHDRDDDQRRVHGQPSGAAPPHRSARELVAVDGAQSSLRNSRSWIMLTVNTSTNSTTPAVAPTPKLFSVNACS